MARGNITQTFRLQGRVLAEFMRSEDYFQVVRGPLGSSKTTTCFAKVLKLFQEQRPDAEGVRRSRIAAIRATYPELSSILIPDVKKLLRPEMGKVIMGHPPVAKLSYPLPDGTRVESEIVFLAVDRVDDIRKLRGMQLTFIWINELRFVVDSSIVAEALSRCNRYPAPMWSPWVGGLADSNAWDEESWIEQFATGFLDEELSDQLGAWKFFTQPPAVIRTDHNDPDGYKSQSGGYWRVNPGAENLDKLGPEYYANQIATNKDDWIRVNLANELGFSLAGKPVHPKYSEERHREKENYKPVAHLPIFVGLDFGMTAAAAYLQKDVLGVWHWFDEIVLEEGGIPTLCTCIKYKNAEWAAAMGVEERMLRITYIGDPSGDATKETDEKTAFQIMAADGIYAIPARSNDTAIRREALDRPLSRDIGGMPGIMLSPRCKVSRKGLASGFIYKRLKVAGMEVFKDVPDKNKFSHVIEAGEYGLMNAGEHAIVDSTFNRSPQGRARNKPIQPTGAVGGTTPAWSVF